MTSVRFSSSDDEQLIELVSGHPVLWNLADKKFKSAVQKEIVWNKIGKIVNKSAAQCKIRWRSIKDYYKKQKKGEKNVSIGSSAIKRRSSYWNSLSFLDLEEVETNTITIVKHEPLSEDITIDEWKPEILPRINEEERCSNINDERFRNDSNTDNLVQRQQERQQDGQHIETTTKQSEGEDEIDLFFRAMAATVKKFRTDLKTKTKVKVFAIVTEMETINQGGSESNT